MKKHKFIFRIYWEDTDAGGIVYYANYLKFCERARTEMLRDAGIYQSEIGEKEGIYFVVRHFEGDLFKPARLDDLIEVTTSIVEMKGASMQMEQVIKKDGEDLFKGKFLIACVGKGMKPARIPESILNKL